MQKYVREVMPDLESWDIVWSATGSRVFGTAREDSDYDYILYIHPENMRKLCKKLEEQGWKDCGTEYEENPDEWFICRKIDSELGGNINLIITNRRDFFDLWMCCHNVINHNLIELNKENIATLFRIVFAGME